jgi:hypothetical protein
MMQVCSKNDLDMGVKMGYAPKIAIPIEKSLRESIGVGVAYRQTHMEKSQVPPLGTVPPS